MNCILGVDGGGSKTICIIMDDAGKILGRGKAGASNYQSIGIAAAQKQIQSAINQATITALNHTNTINIIEICMGLAGVSRPEVMKVVKDIVSQLQNSKDILPITWEFQPSHIVICHDALIALMGGIGNAVGIVVAAGTGSIIFGRNHQGETKRVGGLGYILGDEGSGYKIAVAGMQAALKAYDGRGKSTILLDNFQQYLQIENIEKLIEIIYRKGWGVKEIAALAPIVDQAASEGDKIANRIIDEAVRELVIATATVIDQIFDSNQVVEIVTTGSIWLGKCGLRERFVNFMIHKYPLVNIIYPRHEPAYGAGLLALKALAGNW
ncbi:ATPase [Sphaerospermopsis aphanizomenoides BCCUSP55]|uniref:N-acetylglucosamine kinase n=1 Tax=Sphaerospermopsis aphanizomenoides TaxID=459663 RepID=UPI001908664C|nr:BadF/BadG/BcrA/BcrD ATPase family protein [Sphaerospermopsis aphanizomenoides]MBK1990133.1 ATPase [Sphaerospermopsis aphanizomenoides BCCUSP55]